MSSWYTEKSAQNGITVSTRVRLARNLKGLPFTGMMNDSQRQELMAKAKAAVKERRDLKFIDMADVPQLEIGSMVERHIISPEFSKFSSGRAIILSTDESISIMVGEEDHIRIQVILAGLQPERAYEIASEIDSFLNKSLNFAFDSQLGYLTECPTNVGTGLRASVMLHLPLLEATGMLKPLGDDINKIGFTVRGLYGEGTKSSASLYQISNQITLGISEENAIENLTAIVGQLTEREIKAQEKLEKLPLEDKIYRALGTLQGCRIIDSMETVGLLSLIKLGCRMGILEVDYPTLRAMVETGAFMLMKKYGELTPEERDVKRADYVRECFSRV